jgi:uracil-DNA glycosylase family 4
VLKIVPLTLREANAFITTYHRHHKPVVGHRFSLGCLNPSGLVGAVVVGRPVAREVNQYRVAEVTRLVSDGTTNVCSKLYSSAARICKEMGFQKIQTYILETELGTSLKASGWSFEATTAGGDWNHGVRKGRRTDQPMISKQRWSKTFPENVTMARSHAPNRYEKSERRLSPLQMRQASMGPRLVFGEGPEQARLMLIGERPGEHESRSGRPFVGAAGEIMNTMLAATDLDRKQIYVTNLVKSFADYDKPTQEDIAQWGSVLTQEILMCRPEVIGLLGAYAVQYVLKRPRADMERTHGVPVQAVIQGEDDNGDGSSHTCVCVPMLHPAGGLYNPDALANILDDFLRLGQYLDGEIQIREDSWKGRERYEEWTKETGGEAGFYVRSDCAVDTEGSRDQPWCLTWSTAPGTGYMVKTVPRHSGFEGHVWLHNSLHDLGVLRNMGIELEEGQFTDTMVLAYHLCIEPQGLKALAYRHCGAEQDEYLELVEEASEEKALGYFLEMAGREWPDPEPYIVLEKGLPKTKKPQNVGKRVMRALNDLAGDKRNKDGEPVNLRKRWQGWDDEIKAPVIEVLGDMPVGTLDDVDPDKAMRYACRDADITLRLAPVLMQKIKDMELVEAVAVDHAIIPMIDRMQEVGVKLAGKEFWDGIEDKCLAQMGRSKYALYKATGAQINPGSGDQVAELLYGQLGLTPPKMTDSGERGSVNALALESLLAECPVVQHIMDYNEAQKIKGTYVEPLRKLCQIGDGRARATARITRTTTGRMSLADPPLHQIPIMTELGRELRAGFVAEEGNVLGDWDLDQIEMRMMAHESRDPELTRLFHEGRDVHTETTCKIFSVKESDLAHGEDGKVKDSRRTVAKHAGFGIINGITEYGLLNYLILNRCKRPDGESWTLDDVVMILGEWFNIYGGVRKFQQECVAEAQMTGMTRENVSGRIQYLPAVWSPVKRVRESAERVAYVHKIQGGAAALMKRIMANVWKEICKPMVVDCLLWVHDELLCELPESKPVMQDVDRVMTRIMRDTVKLSVPVKASGGYAKNWLEAH